MNSQSSRRRDVVLLYNPDLYLRAYARLYPNQGALTKGSTAETAVWPKLTRYFFVASATYRVEA